LGRFDVSICGFSYAEATVSRRIRNLTPMPDDDFNSVTLPSAADHAPSIGTQTTWTLLLYLTSAAEGCVGGETVFYPCDRKVEKEGIAVALETGMLLLHKHGNDCLLVRAEKTLKSVPQWC
jgi:hypothetical protein